MGEVFFFFFLALEGPSVESKNLFKSTFLFLYGNTNLWKQKEVLFCNTKSTNMALNTEKCLHL